MEKGPNIYPEENLLKDESADQMPDSKESQNGEIPEEFDYTQSARAGEEVARLTEDAEAAVAATMGPQEKGWFSQAKEAIVWTLNNPKKATAAGLLAISGLVVGCGGDPKRPTPDTKPSQNTTSKAEQDTPEQKEAKRKKVFEALTLEKEKADDRRKEADKAHVESNLSAVEIAARQARRAAEMAEELYRVIQARGNEEESLEALKLLQAAKDSADVAEQWAKQTQAKELPKLSKEKKNSPEEREKARLLESAKKAKEEAQERAEEAKKSVADSKLVQAKEAANAASRAAKRADDAKKELSKLSQDKAIIEEITRLAAEALEAAKEASASIEKVNAKEKQDKVDKLKVKIKEAEKELAYLEKNYPTNEAQFSRMQKELKETKIYLGRVEKGGWPFVKQTEEQKRHIKNLEAKYPEKKDRETLDEEIKKYTKGEIENIITSLKQKRDDLEEIINFPRNRDRMLRDLRSLKDELRQLEEGPRKFGFSR